MGETRRAGVTRAAMVAAALDLLTEVGLDGLTVRRLATALGVQSPSLYWHIRTKQELLDGMADAIIAGAGMGPPEAGEDWRAWLTRRARAYRAALLRHRDGARIVASARQLGPATLVPLNAEIAALEEQGFPPVLGLRTITTISMYTIGFVLQEQAGAEPAPADLLTTVAAELPGGAQAPLIRAIVDSGRSREDAFTHGLTTILTGTTPLLPPG